MPESESRKVDCIVMILGEYAKEEGRDMRDAFFELLDFEASMLSTSSTI